MGRSDRRGAEGRRPRRRLNHELDGPPDDRFADPEVYFSGRPLPSLPDTLVAFDRAGLMLVEVESLWPHYQRTMDEWRKNFAKGWSEIQQSDPGVFTETFRRRWTMYLEGTGEAFGTLDLSHIVFAKDRHAGYFPPFVDRPNGGPIHLRRSGTGVLRMSSGLRSAASLPQDTFAIEIGESAFGSYLALRAS